MLEEKNLKKKILYLCTGNSCRSQMAEAITNTMHNEDWTAVSAGTKPAGYVHPFALKVLQELDIIHKGRSKSVDEFKGMDLDLVITVCDEADDDCPVWLGSGEKIHLGFTDPAAAIGTEEEILKVFRDVRDQIQQQLPTVLDR
jgi:arsenate reductase